MAMSGEVTPPSFWGRRRSGSQASGGLLAGASTALRRSSSRSMLAPVGCTLVVIAILWAGIGYHLAQRREAVIESARSDAADLSTSLGEQVKRLIAGVDQVLRFMQADFARHPAQFDFDTWTRGADSLVDALVQISITDVSGAIVASTVLLDPGAMPVSIADREHFQVHVTDPRVGLFVGRAVRGRVSDRWSIQLSRRLAKPDGSFAGVVVASLDPEYIAGQFGLLDAGEDGSICLVGFDGFVRSRSPFTPATLNLDYRTRPAGKLTFAKLDGLQPGQRVAFTAEDDDLLVGVRSVDGLPLLVATSRPKEAILRAFETERRHVVTAGIGTTALLLGLLAWLLRELQRRHRREVELSLAHRELASALQDLKAEAIQRESAEEALRQSQKMEALGQLTGGIAHDFNNLLTGIIGSLDLMERRISQGRAEAVGRYIGSAMASANRAVALTHRLLAFSRRQPLDPKPVDAGQLVAGIGDLLRRTIGETIRLDIFTASGLWPALCDPPQLENALLNLVINARDAMPGGGLLSVSTRNARDDETQSGPDGARPGQYVCLCVSDTGTGMSPDVAAKAFDPFFTTKPIGQGTGLGLSMIYGFAQQSRGFVTLDSTLGKGTSVRLYLPRHRGEAHGDEEQRARIGDAHRAACGATVLVIEDEDEVRSLVVEVLREVGYEALEAVDGPSGLELLRSGRLIDLLLTDVGLPGINGRQVADAARCERPDLKVLFMTGYAEAFAAADGDLEKGMELLTKPFTIEELALRVRDMLKAG